MKCPVIRIHSGLPIMYGVLCLLLIFLSACGGNPNDAEYANDTGSIGFSLTWEHPGQSPAIRAKALPGGNCCESYGIDTISAYVYNSKDEEVAFGSWPCSAGQGEISNVPPGSGLRIVVKGSVSDVVLWQGEITGLSVSAGQVKNAGIVTMIYQGTDNTAPWVISTTTDPPNGAVDVSLTQPITVTFSEDLAPPSVNATTFTLASGTATVSGSVSYDSDSKTATFIPDGGLSHSATYTATITSEVEDRAGIPMDGDYTWSFTTTPGIPSAPIQVSATGEDAKVTISWDTVPGATSYHIYWSKTSGDKTTGTKIPNVTSPYLHSNLTNGEIYYYVVTAENSNGEGDSSSEVSAMTGGCLASSAWPMRGHDLRHTGQSPYLGAQNNTLKWSYQTEGHISSSPAIGIDGTIYIGSDDGKLYALDPNGSLKWSYQTEGTWGASPVVRADGTVYIGSLNGKFYALDPNGSLKWSYQTQGYIESSPAIGADGTVYIGSWSGKIYALKPDGNLKWAYGIGGYVKSSPAIGDDKTIYVGCCDGRINALKPDGSLKWSYQTGDEVTSSPTIGADGTVYVGSFDKNVYALSPDGSLKWRYQIGDIVHLSSPAIAADGTIYIGSYDHNIYALNPDGSLKWSCPTADWVISSPALGVDGTIYVGSNDGKVYAIKPDGNPKWTYQTGIWINSSPAIATDGTVYIGSGDGKVYAFGNIDNTPPTVVSTSIDPPDGAVDISLTQHITVTFSEDLAPASVNASTFTLTSGSASVRGIVTYDAASRTASFIPAVGSFSSSVTYTATITSGVDGVADMAGNHMAANYSWSFTTLPLQSGRTLWAWGDNNHGQLGDGTNTFKNTPVQIGSDNKWVSMAAGYDHTIALKSDRTLWAWGSNDYGQLGDGTNTYKTTPVQIGSDNKWISIAAGNAHTVALKSEGTLWAWGRNNLSQLGDGTNTDKNTPVQIGSDNKWVSISAGSGHTIALKSDGTLWAWGCNYYGELGDGTNTDKNTPVQIGSDNKWVSISAGYSHTIALKSDGTLWAWGVNIRGELGDGTNTDKNTPVQIGSDNKWVSISAGYNHTVALKSDETLWAWGPNYYGELGDGTNTEKNTPVQIGSDNKWVSISAGNGHTIALKSDGTLWAWGRNNLGQLGDGTTTDKNTPVQIGSDNEWVSVAIGNEHTIALSFTKTNTPPWIGSDPNEDQIRTFNITEEDSPVLITLSSGSDADGDPLFYKITALPIAGRAFLLGRLYQYIASDNFQGDQIVYFPAELTDPGHRVVYEPANCHSSYTDTFYCSVNDGTSDSGNKDVININVNADNDPPWIGDFPSVDLFCAPTMNEEGPSLVIALGPGSDAEGDPLLYKITALPTEGKLYQYITSGDHMGEQITYFPVVVTDSSHRVVYEPVNYISSYNDTFRCRVNDGASDSVNDEVISINVNADNDPPWIGSDPENHTSSIIATGLCIITLSEGFDPEGNSLAYKITSLPAKGKLYQYIASGNHKGNQVEIFPVVLTDPNHQVVYEPCSYLEGTYYVDTFTCNVNDGISDSVNTDLINISVDVLANLDRIQWKVEDGGNGHYYKLFSEYLSWQDARVTAESMQGYLATITSEEENSWVPSTFSLGPGIARQSWLGGYQDKNDPGYSEPADGWKWITGEPMNYKNWDTGYQPDNCYGPGGYENYLAIYSDGKWNDYAETAPFLVEWDN